MGIRQLIRNHRRGHERSLEAPREDPTGAQYSALAERYGRGPMTPPDAPTRVVLVAEPYHVTTMG